MKKFLMMLATLLACICITACTPSSLADARTKMAEAGYNVNDALTLGMEGVLGGVSATKGGIGGSGLLGGESLTAYYFDTNEAAKNYYEANSDKSNITLDGKWVFYGTEGGINAFKK